MTVGTHHDLGTMGFKPRAEVSARNRLVVRGSDDSYRLLFEIVRTFTTKRFQKSAGLHVQQLNPGPNMMCSR